jgi:hypothetical protein
MAIAESSTVAVSYVGVGAGGGEQSPPISLQNETNATPAAPNTPGGDPGLTVLQPPVSQPQVASAIPPYSTMLPSFGHYATGEYQSETALALTVRQERAALAYPPGLEPGLAIQSEGKSGLCRGALIYQFGVTSWTFRSDFAKGQAFYPETVAYQWRINATLDDRIVPCRAIPE